MTEEEYVALRKGSMQGYLESLEAVTEYLERFLPSIESSNVAMNLLEPCFKVRERLLTVIKEQNEAILLVRRVLAEIKADLDQQEARLKPQHANE